MSPSLISDYYVSRMSHRMVTINLSTRIKPELLCPVDSALDVPTLCPYLQFEELDFEINSEFAIFG